ncbi:uncharacterized protein zgc:100829 isoform X2 [Alosa alosa]|uniref:uncharacterized protein zgc:100829 isoform X2 n=1 Tax=Alosa alosa TaxID=278164 RepID=UPI0020153F4D|nr:uncharacterized protein zgc:100829 isoform X2 [Alosa alosa]
MLQQILKDMYIEPELLEALSEEQKKTLFTKMRQEQVRRWNEREEKMEGEEAHRPKAKTGQSKSVSWLLGRDGDVQVFVIGEVDELKSKLIYTGLGERNTSSLCNNSRTQAATFKSNLINRTSPDSVRSGRENHPPKTQAGIQLNLKDNTDEMKPSPPLQVPLQAQESQEDTESAPADAPADALVSPVSPPPAYRPHLRPGSTRPLLTAASLLKGLDRSGGSIRSSVGMGSSGSASALLSGTGSSGSSSNSSAPLVNTGSGSGSSSSSPLGGPGSRMPPAETQEPQSSRGKDFRVVTSKRALSVDEVGASASVVAPAAVPAAVPVAVPVVAPAAVTAADVCVGRGRVAQLMKTFSVCGETTPPVRSSKPPIPSKPNHLRMQQSASLR